jgi:hypothetical protein
MHTQYHEIILKQETSGSYDVAFPNKKGEDRDEGGNPDPGD